VVNRDTALVSSEELRMDKVDDQRIVDLNAGAMCSVVLPPLIRRTGEQHIFGGWRAELRLANLATQNGYETRLLTTYSGMTQAKARSPTSITCMVASLPVASEETSYA